MGCMHFGILDAKDYEALAQKAREYNPDFVVFFSDTLDSPGEAPIEFSRQEFHSAIGKLNIPVYDLFKDGQSSFEYKNNLFAYSDSLNPPEQTKNFNNLFIFAHQSPWFEQDVEWAKITPVLIQKKLRYIFGPNLQCLELKKRGNSYTISRDLSCCLRRHPEVPFLHFLVVNVDKNKTSVEFVSIKSPQDFKEILPSSASKYVPSKQETLVKLHILKVQRELPLSQNPSRILEALKIKPGMNILDLGAGAGFFTFRFAEALKGTGRVFATEIDPDMIEYIKGKMKQTQFKNIFPVLVKPEGVDHFYKEHTFDIVFLSETYQCLNNPEDYFRQLRPSLKDTGRLYIINPNNVIDFSENEFGDFKRVVQVLAYEGKTFLVFQRLSKKVQDFILRWHGEDIPLNIRAKITNDFNRMLSDRWLFNDIMAYYVPRESIILRNGLAEPAQFREFPSNLRWDKWLITSLYAGEVFNRKKESLTDIDKRQVRILNKILIPRIFGIIRRPDTQVLKNRTISTMQAAGYELMREYDFFKDYYFLEFKRRF